MGWWRRETTSYQGRQRQVDRRSTRRERQATRHCWAFTWRGRPKTAGRTAFAARARELRLREAHKAAKSDGRKAGVGQARREGDVEMDVVAVAAVDANADEANADEAKGEVAPTEMVRNATATLAPTQMQSCAVSIDAWQVRIQNDYVIGKGGQTCGYRVHPYRIHPYRIPRRPQPFAPRVLHWASATALRVYCIGAEQSSLTHAPIPRCAARCTVSKF
eukprot:IDg20643t1